MIFSIIFANGARFHGCGVVPSLHSHCWGGGTTLNMLTISGKQMAEVLYFLVQADVDKTLSTKPSSLQTLILSKSLLFYVLDLLGILAFRVGSGTLPVRFL